MKNKAAAILGLLLTTTTLYPHQVSVQTGLLKKAISPDVDFGIVTYKHGAYRIGAFNSPDAQGIVASYSSTASNFLLELGQREKSLDQGFIISNGAYLPWTKNFAFSEPVGIRTGYQTRYADLETNYYQYDAQNVAAANFHLKPTDWLRISGGAATQNIELAQRAIPIAALFIGERDDYTGFKGGVEYAGSKNVLIHARYTDGFTLRGLVFWRSEENSLASGIYAQKQGIVTQFISDNWFAQFFQTDSRFGMLRYGGAYLTGVAVYEEQTQIAGLSLRNSATGFHVRSGASVGVDGSLQTLAGLGYADFVFLGGGHFALYSEQPLEPIIFPSEWYSSVLLQSTNMRVKDTGFKVMALVNTETVRGFFAVTHAKDVRGRERFEFFMRISGQMTF